LVEKVGEFVGAYQGDMAPEAFGTALEGFIKDNSWPMGKVMNATRLALTGAASGLGIADIIVRIGKAETERRISYAVQRL
jgi:glutamyl/glutaminyl-tRNA synthetase